MQFDPIVEEIRAGREACAARFNYDIEAICRDLREQERLSGREVITLSPKSPEPVLVVEEPRKAA